MSAKDNHEGMQEIDITKLNLQQLSQLKQRLEQVNFNYALHTFKSFLLFNGGFRQNRDFIN